MTTEAELRARLLAYYEDRLTLLAARIAALEAFQGAAEEQRAQSVDGNLKRARGEFADLQEKARRLREAIAGT